MKKSGTVISIIVIAIHSLIFGQSSYGAYYEKGISAFNFGRYEEAYQFFKLAETNGISDKQFYAYFAISAKKTGRGDAVEILQRGLNRFPADADLSLMAAQYLSEKNKFRQAIQVLKKARKNIIPQEYNNIMAVLTFNEGVRLYQKKQKKESVSWFRETVRYDDGNPRFIRNLAIVLWETGKKEDAVAVLEKYLPHFADDAEMNSLLLTFYQKKGDLAKLQIQLEKRVNSGHKLEDYLTLEQFYLLTSNDKKADELFNKMQKRFPKEKKIYLTPIRYYRRIFLYDHADSLLDRMQREFPRDTLVCKLKAENYEDMDSLKLAVKYWRKCLTLHPEKSAWRFRILKNLKKSDSLRYASYLDTLQTVLTSKEDRFKTALILWHDKRIYEALSIFKALYSNDPKDGATLTYLGLCLRAAGRDSQAVSYFQKAVSAQNTLPQAYMGLANYYYKYGDTENGDAYFKLGLNALLDKLRQTQQKIVKPLHDNLLTTQNGNLSEIAAEYEDYEKILQNELLRYVKIHTPDASEKFISGLLENYPKNVFLRLILCDLAIDDRQYQKADELIDDALFIKPGYPPALRRKITLAKRQKDDMKLFRAYLSLLYQQPQELSDDEYRQLLETARRIGQLNSLSRQLVTLYKRDKSNRRLKRFTIECLHIAGNHAEARRIAAETAPKRSANKKTQMSIINNKI